MPRYAPGRARRQTTARSTLPKRQWAMPETSVVTTSPACTEADTVAGARPRVRSSVVDVTPYPIPRAPSMSWATNPDTARIKS